MDTVKSLLDQGVFLPHVIYYAALGGNADIVTLLIEKGDSPSVGLVGAVKAGNLDMVQLLLDKGAYPNEGLAEAVEYGHICIVRLLLEKGANPTPGLFVAAEHGEMEILKLLQAQPGIDVNEKDYDDKTPLDYALEKGYTECAELLRQLGGR